MLHAAILLATLTTSRGDTQRTASSSVQQCFATMDGAVYHGDPSDRRLMKASVATCERGIAELGRTRPQPARGPEKLFLTGRILDRAATLSYMGLGDATTALREVKAANLYFRIAAGLPEQSADYHAAAVLNAELTGQQLTTLRADIAAARTSEHERTIAARGRLSAAYADAALVEHKL